MDATCSWKFKLFGEGECDKCGQKAYHVCRVHGEKLCSSDYRKLAFSRVKGDLDAALNK